MDKQILKSLFILVFLSISFPVKSEPTTQIEYKFYDIYPSTPKDIGREMHQRSPIIYNGKKFKGLTNWHVSWRYNWQLINGKCNINTASTNLKVKYTMPRISSRHYVTPQVEQAFNQYYDALLLHEEGHKDSGLYAAREIEQELLAMKSFANCSQLEKAANHKARQIIKKYNERDLNYDRETGHGRLQGVDINNFLR